MCHTKISSFKGFDLDTQDCELICTSRHCRNPGRRGCESESGREARMRTHGTETHIQAQWAALAHSARSQHDMCPHSSGLRVKSGLHRRQETASRAGEHGLHRHRAEKG